MLSDHLSTKQFLAEYWQKKPVLLKQALADFHDPLSPEELAGLACEDEAEARLVFSEAENWRLVSGPFSEQDFVNLPETGWTLLVQAVDQWFPAVKALQKHLGFIPDWRLDDVMVSYATEAAGVGPHFDYYDVFIIQGQGSRKWQLGQSCNENTSLRVDAALKILEEFTVHEEFVLEAGDVLYIPPGIAHQGIALNPSLSYSIGFRAPSNAELFIQFAAHLCADLSEDHRYSDPELQIQDNPAEITQQSLAKVKTLITSIMQNSLQQSDGMEEWFGQLMTRRKYPEHTFLPEPELDADALSAALANGTELEKHPAARFAFIRHPDALTLFVDGQSFPVAVSNSELGALVLELNDRNISKLNLGSYEASAECLNLLCALYNQGSLIEVETLN